MYTEIYTITPSNPQPALPLQVLKTLEEGGPSPAPFALAAQNVAAIDKVRAERNGGDQDMPEMPQPASSVEPTAAVETLASSGAEKATKPWDYNARKTEFIKKLRGEAKCSFEEARTKWDSSEEKKNYLGAVSVKELRKRKFIAKGCQTNPWAR